MEKRRNARRGTEGRCRESISEWAVLIPVKKANEPVDVRMREDAANKVLLVTDRPAARFRGGEEATQRNFCKQLNRRRQGG